MTYMGSTWTFDEERKEAVARDQNALRAMEQADPAFAKAITAKLVPDRVENPDVLRQVKP